MVVAAPVSPLVTVFAAPHAADEALAALRANGIQLRLVDEAVARDNGEPGVRTFRTRANQPRVTLRQRQVLYLVADGRTTPEIARWLGITENIVKGDLRIIYKRLGVRDRAHAVMTALRAGLLDGGEA